MDVLRLLNRQETTSWSLFAIMNSLNTNQLVQPRHVNQYKKFNAFVIDTHIDI